MSTIPLITGLDTRYNDRLRAPTLPIATTTPMILALDDSTGGKTVVSAGYPATILSTVAGMDSRLSYLENNSYETIIDVAYADLSVFISSGAVNSTTITPGDAIRTQDGAINSLKFGGDKTVISDWIEVRPPQSTFTSINNAISSAQSTASNALSIATTVQNYSFSVDSATSTQRVYSYGTSLLAPQSTFTIPSATNYVAGLMSGDDKAAISKMVRYDAQTLTTTEKNQVKQNLDIFGTNLSASSTSTTVQISSSTGTSGTISAATTLLAGVMTAADKTKLDGLPSSIPATDLSLAVTTTQVGINSSTGADVVILAATGSLAGVMSAADKTKLDGLPSSIPATNLSNTPAASTVAIASSTGTGTTLPAATASLAGVMSSADKTKLDGLPASIPATNLSNTQGASTVTINSSTGTGTTIPAATTSTAGVLTSADKVLVNTISSKEPAITSGTTAQYWRGDKSWVTLDKTAVGLSNVDNTSDLNKPLSTATSTALGTKEPTISTGTIGQYFRGDKTWQTLDKTSVGLSNVDNTSDLSKPVSTATSNALANKENLISVGTTSQYWRGDKSWQILDKTAVGLGNVDNTSDLNKPLSTATLSALNGKENLISVGTTGQYWRGDKTWQTLNKSAVGLANVDNTSDLNKPISTATSTALAGKEATITAGTTAQYWRGDKSWQTLDKTAVGLSNVDNTSDLNKPISTAVDHEFASIGGSGAYYAQSMSVNGTDPSKFDIGIVHGWVVTQGPNPTRVDVHFAGQTGISVTNLASADLTYVALDSAGNVIQQTTPFTEPSRRQYIVLGILGHGSRTTIASANLVPSLINSVNSRFEMLSDLFGVVNVSGNVFSAGASNLTINKTAGRVWSVSSNYSIDPLTPDFRVTSALTPATFSRLTRSAITALGVNTIDTNNYDNLGTLTTLPTNRFAIHRIYMSPNNSISVQYGQATYTSLSAATAAIDVEPFVENPNFNSIACLRCFLIVKGQITTLTNPADTSFIAAGKFGSALGAIAGSGGTTNLSVSNITGTTLDIVSDTGLDATVPSATASTAGLLSAADKVLVNTITSKEPTITAGTTAQYWRGDKSWQTLDKTAVGLSNVDNTSDLNKPVSTATTTAINTAVSTKENTITAGTTAQYWRGDKSWQTLDKTAVGLANVDNTSDLDKPVSTATTTAINTAVSTKENTITIGTTAQYWRGDKTWQTLDKTAVGLSNVDNTSDLNKPVSTATTTAINTAVSTKENTITAGTTLQYWRGDKTWQTLDKTAVGLSNVDNTSDANKPISSAVSTALSGKEATITVGTTAQYWRGDKSWQTLDKTSVGLSNVDNTSDANKPISSAVSTALAGKEATITAGTTSQYWRGDKTWQTLDKTAVGLANVDNTSDANKPISTAVDNIFQGIGDVGLVTEPSVYNTGNTVYYSSFIVMCRDEITGKHIRKTVPSGNIAVAPSGYPYSVLSYYEYYGVVTVDLMSSFDYSPTYTTDYRIPISIISHVDGVSIDYIIPRPMMSPRLGATVHNMMWALGVVNLNSMYTTPKKFVSNNDLSITVETVPLFFSGITGQGFGVTKDITSNYGVNNLSFPARTSIYLVTPSYDVMTLATQVNPTIVYDDSVQTTNTGYTILQVYVTLDDKVCVAYHNGDSYVGIPTQFATIAEAEKYLPLLEYPVVPRNMGVRIGYIIIHNSITNWNDTTKYKFIGCDKYGYPKQLLPQGSTNLSLSNITTTTIDVLSDTGTDVTLPSATAASAGLMTAEQVIALGTAIPGAPVTENVVTNTTYTMQTSDAGKVVMCTSNSPVTVTFTSMPAGGTTGMIEQMGDGQVTIAVTGYTLRHVANLTKTAGKYSRIFWRITSDNTQIIVSGDMA